jgi:hypothetical protein
MFAHFCWSRWDDKTIFGTRFSGKIPDLGKKDRDSITITNNELIELHKECYSIVDELLELEKRLPELEEGKEVLALIKATEILVSMETKE